jgi:hypothetical protein
MGTWDDAERARINALTLEADLELRDHVPHPDRPDFHSLHLGQLCCNEPDHTGDTFERCWYAPDHKGDHSWQR